MAKEGGIAETLWAIQPRNIEVELNLLAALLRGGVRQADLYEAISDTLAPEHFFEPDNAEAYRLISSALESGKTATHLNLANHIPADLMSKLSAGAMGALISEREFIDWAEEIAETSARRNVCHAGRQAVNDAVAAPRGTKPSDLIAAAESILYSAVPEAAAAGGPMPFQTALDRAMAKIDAAQKDDGHLTGVTTGLIDLDEALGKITGAQLIILGARPSMGKTGLALDIADHMSKIGIRSGKAVAFFSLEMNADKLAQRRLARETGISISRQNEKMTEAEIRKIGEAYGRLSNPKIPLYIDESSGLNLSQIRARARRLNRQHGLSVILIDYLEMMSDEPHMLKAPKNYQIGVITRGLKDLAKELGIPVILLVQVNRKVEEREDKRPMLSDLKDSGNIEQDADVVLFLYRDEYYLTDAEPEKAPHEKDEKYQARVEKYYRRISESAGVAEAIIAKNRDGKRNVTVKLRFDEGRVTFENLARGSRR